MCDYSLMGVPNRLAEQGEELCSHRFSTGSIGLAPAAEVAAYHAWGKANAQAGMLADIFSCQKRPIVHAACLLPGTRLVLSGIPSEIQQSCGVGAVDKVTFTQITAQENTHRDAFRFGNGNTVLIQKCGEGVRVLVESLEDATEREEVAEEVFTYARR